jgi:oligopeptide transport system substrate-binding protein
LRWPRCPRERKGGACPPFLVSLIVSLLVASWAAAFAQEHFADSPGSGTVYRRPLGNDPVTLDPARISDVYSRTVSQQIFDGLVRFDQTLAVAPALAQYWTASRDGLSWTFTLRKGVKFHHGRPLTADDVVFSLTRILDPRLKSGAADLLAGIKGAREFREGRASRVIGLVAPDRHTVQVTLDETQAPFVSTLAVGHAKIVPRDVVEAEGEAFGARPVGTGPFRFLRSERGKEIVLAANHDHFEGTPRLSRIVYRIFPGDVVDAMYAEFVKGDLEDTPIPTQDYRRIVRESRYQRVKRPMLSVRFFGFNTRIRPFDDRRVRQAFISAIDREALVEDVLLGRYILARGILPPGTLGYNPKLTGYPYDPSRARELLSQAGYPGGRGLGPIAIWSTAAAEAALRESREIKRYLAAVGINAEFHYLTDWPAFSRKLGDGRFPVFLYAWFADVPDPDNFLFELFHSRSRRNFTGFSNPRVDDLLVHARAEPDLGRRFELYRRAEQMIVDEAPVMPVFHYTYERLFQPYVRSVEVNGLGDPYIPLRKIWLEPAR